MNYTVRGDNLDPEDARISGRSHCVAGRLRGPALDEEPQRRQPVLCRRLA
jgi:hypothetical protein